MLTSKNGAPLLQGSCSPLFCQALRSETIPVAKKAALARTSSGTGAVQECAFHVIPLSPWTDGLLLIMPQLNILWCRRNSEVNVLSNHNVDQLYRLHSCTLF